MAEGPRYGDTIGGPTATPTPFESEITNIVKYGLAQLPQGFKLPHELLVEVVPHDLLNERVRQARVPAVLFGFSTDKGRRIVLSDVLLQLPPAERNRHILHEVWHIGQLASDYHPGLERSEYDAWAFAERHKHLA
jgi:hypothetical protein